MRILSKFFQANDAIMVFSLEIRNDMEVFFLEGSDWLQTSPSGARWRNSSSVGITESCKIAAELFHAAVLWCLCLLLIFPVIAVSHAALCCPTHLYACLNSHCGSQTEHLFETLLIIKQQRFWMKLKMRWGPNFILHWRAPFHCWKLCMQGFRLSRQQSLFICFAPTFLIVIISEDETHVF